MPEHPRSGRKPVIRPHLCLLLALLPMAALAEADPDPALVERGAYLARIMDCSGCHTPRGADGAPDMAAQLTGGTVGFDMGPTGIFWPPNLTPSPEGLGNWTDEQIVTAITTGLRPDGRVLAPIMPWMGYAALTAEDSAALVAYLRSLPADPRPSLGFVTDPAEAKAPYFTLKTGG